jgi:hypothetical protein
MVSAYQQDRGPGASSSDSPLRQEESCGACFYCQRHRHKRIESPNNEISSLPVRFGRDPLWRGSRGWRSLCSLSANTAPETWPIWAKIGFQPTKVQAKGLIKKAPGVDIKSAWARILPEGQADNSVANSLQRPYITGCGVLLKSK